jgi:hypothetical protein
MSSNSDNDNKCLFSSQNKPGNSLKIAKKTGVKPFTILTPASARTISFEEISTHTNTDINGVVDKSSNVKRLKIDSPDSSESKTLMQLVSKQFAKQQAPSVSYKAGPTSKPLSATNHGNLSAPKPTPKSETTSVPVDNESFEFFEKNSLEQIQLRIYEKQSMLIGLGLHNDNSDYFDIQQSIAELQRQYWMVAKALLPFITCNQRGEGAEPL